MEIGVKGVLQARRKIQAFICEPHVIS